MKSKCLFYRRPSSLITVFGKMIGAFVFYIVQLEMSFGFVSSLKPPFALQILWFFLMAWPCRSNGAISLGASTTLLPKLSSSCASCSSFADVGPLGAYWSILSSVFLLLYLCKKQPVVISEDNNLRFGKSEETLSPRELIELPVLFLSLKNNKKSLKTSLLCRELF